MRLKFQKGKQKEFFLKIKKLKNCDWKNLATFLNINFETLREWVKERRYIPEDIFVKIINLYPQLKIYENYIIEKKENNWGQIKGGLSGGKAIKEKLKNDFKYRIEWVEKCRKGGINNINKGLIKNWEIGFRNIGKRKFIGPKGEKMFTKTEKQIAEFFAENNVKYEYEPRIILNGNNYFPDFMIDNLIIERCGVISKKYFNSLQNKLRDYLNWKGKVILIMPKNVERVLNKNVKIDEKFITITEDDNLSELTGLLGEFVGLK